jgi:hypothetical protein
VRCDRAFHCHHPRIGTDDWLLRAGKRRRRYSCQRRKSCENQEIRELAFTKSQLGRRGAGQVRPSGNPLCGRAETSVVSRWARGRLGAGDRRSPDQEPLVSAGRGG